MVQIKPLSHWSTNDRVLRLAAPYLSHGTRSVDVGAGEGYFSELLSRQGNGTATSACDVFPENFRFDGVPCDAIPCDGRLPYDDATFDVACSLEVIEHVEDQFRFTRELYRILKPGGVAIVSTPNVLNMNSRYRTLHAGFATLFDPLLLSSTDPVHTSGHIHPVSYYYLAYQLRRAGFESVTVHYDRFKRSALGLLLVFGIPILIGRTLFRMRLAHRRPQVAAENEALLADLGSFDMLTSRSVIALATKPR